MLIPVPSGMAYDEVLAQRLRDALEGEPQLTEKKMFGGVGFMIGGNMAGAASSSGDLMVRVDPTQGREWVDGVDVRPMEMGGRRMDGWLFVAIDTVASDDALREWVDRGAGYARSLPPKQK
jgi:hypothetical protein